ncbi:uncharacterized protein LOC113343909 [Papaver somniferum]|uniref:uncharacterized protein LOC113343909 n=1 Tax=Papaver somniferum TaxID=3469 RepID=UPI000E705F60|nr:uncharacterized protein LOC113343909 [Papaver somniferum]
MFLIDASAPPSDLDASTVLQLDALCRQWMFSTMAKVLMLTVLKSGNTAKKIWDHLQHLFQDNKGSRAATLESKFVNLKFIDCIDVDDYCDKLKALASRLSDLDFSMNDKRLVIQLVNGLPEEYNTDASFIQQSMPSSDATRSQLRTEEIRREQQSNSGSHTALAAAKLDLHSPVAADPRRREQKLVTPERYPTAPSPHYAVPTDDQPSFTMVREAPLLPTPAGPRHSYPSPQPYPSARSNWSPHWASPPSPYPTAPSPHYAAPYWASQHTASGRGRGRQHRGRGRGRGRSTLPARSPQAFLTPTTEYLQPTDIAEAYSSMSLHTPDDAFYMDTGATSHITSDPGTLQNVSHSSSIRSIVVGNGNSIPVSASGSKLLNLPSHLLVLNDTLDLSSRKTILRCASSGELYPITTSVVSASSSSSKHNLSLAVCSPDIWHRLFGHLGKAVLDTLRSQFFIQLIYGRHRLT